ncbi:MAG TPA: pseudaminic acid synthase [Spirochaetales bacterium]|nr:pseudaminic acid synthase [Spirochaetales bacterium]
MSEKIYIGNKEISVESPVYFVAELSANHNQKLEDALALIKAAKESGADAVKVQTYTPDTITLCCNSELFKIQSGSIWDGQFLYDLYKEAQTPWEWHEELMHYAQKNELDFFSSPFDKTAVEFLEHLNVPAYKIASFELVDLPLIERVAATGKPVILSTGMATFEEIDEAIRTVLSTGNEKIVLLKCTSAYPASAGDMNLRVIPYLIKKYGFPVGLSDHTLGYSIPVVAVALGACMVEKHLTLSRTIKGPDSAFSLEPHEFKKMVDFTRSAQKSLGEVTDELSESEKRNLIFRRSLFVVEDMKAGEVFTEKNVRSIRPGHGLAPKYLPSIIGKRASRNIKKGSPLNFFDIA